MMHMISCSSRIEILIYWCFIYEFFSLSRNEKNNKILFVDPGHISKIGSVNYLPARTIRGYLEYIRILKNFDSQVEIYICTLAGASIIDENEVNVLQKVPDELSMHIIDLPAVEVVKNEDFDIFYSLLNGKTLEIFPDKSKVVYVSEFSRKTRVDGSLANTSGLVDKIRVHLGEWNMDRKIISAIKQARGMQFNGESVSRMYSKYNQNFFTFYDHRVDQVGEYPVDFPKNSDCFSIAFSGRIIKSKGSQYLSKISHEIYRMNPSIKMLIFGDGEDRHAVINESAPNLEYKGFMDYESEWVPFVKSNIDLMLFPHVQGDPSMTYFEALGVGVPLIGFSNESLDNLVNRGLGWSVSRGDVHAIARKVCELANSPEELQKKSMAGIEFMSQHLYPDVAESRMEHLLASLKK